MQQDKNGKRKKALNLELSQGIFVFASALNDLFERLTSAIIYTTRQLLIDIYTTNQLLISMIMHSVV
ncbi:2-(3-amino-3-carboxypropyl)histidine synthase subunit [Dirofilaria immitis]